MIFPAHGERAFMNGNDSDTPLDDDARAKAWWESNLQTVRDAGEIHATFWFHSKPYDWTRRCECGTEWTASSYPRLGEICSGCHLTIGIWVGIPTPESTNEEGRSHLAAP